MTFNHICITLRGFRVVLEVHDGEDATRISFRTRRATRAGVLCSAIGNGIKVVHAVHAGNASWSLTSSQPPAASCSCTTSPAFACQYRMHVQRLHCAIARSIQRRTVFAQVLHLTPTKSRPIMGPTTTRPNGGAQRHDRGRPTHVDSAVRV